MGTKKSSIGIFFDSGGISLARLSARGRRLEDSFFLEHEGSLFEGNYVDPVFHDSALFTELLSEALRRLSGFRKSSDVEVHLSMDDSLSSSVILQMASLPSKRNEALMILERKIHDGHPYLKQRELVMDYSIIEDERGSREGLRCLVTFMLKSFSDALKTCFSKSGMYPLSLDSAWSISHVAAGSMLGIRDFVLAVIGRGTITLGVVQSSRIVVFRKANRGLDEGVSSAVAELERSFEFLRSRNNFQSVDLPMFWVTTIECADFQRIQSKLNAELLPLAWKDLGSHLESLNLNGLSGGILQASMAAFTGDK
jgi:hypothetical protein